MNRNQCNRTLHRDSGMTESRWNRRDMNEYLKDRNDMKENECVNVYEHGMKEEKERSLNDKRERATQWASA